MPIPLIAAGVAAAGAIGGAAISAHATSKAAKASTNATNAQIAAADRNRDFQYGLNQPVIDQGRAADDRISALLGLGGDPAAAKAGFDAYRDSTGFGFRQEQGTKAIDANAYAHGMGRSGATYKRLLDYGQKLGSQEFGNYLGQLGGVSAAGGQGRAVVAGVGANTVNTQAQALATNATNQGNAAIAQGNNINNTIGQLIQAGGFALGSSYGGGGAFPAYQIPTSKTNFGYPGYGG
jgi:hypothetical protein